MNEWMSEWMDEKLIFPCMLVYTYSCVHVCAHVYTYVWKNSPVIIGQRCKEMILIKMNQKRRKLRRKVYPAINVGLPHHCDCASVTGLRSFANVFWGIAMHI